MPHGFEKLTMSLKPRELQAEVRSAGRETDRLRRNIQPVLLLPQVSDRKVRNVIEVPNRQLILQCNSFLSAILY